MTKRIAIVGGGPIGLEAGLLAARNGCEVTVYERGRVAVSRSDSDPRSPRNRSAIRAAWSPDSAGPSRARSRMYPRRCQSEVSGDMVDDH